MIKGDEDLKLITYTHGGITFPDSGLTITSQGTINNLLHHCAGDNDTRLSGSN